MSLKTYLSKRGNAAKLARILGLTEGQVSQWKNDVRRVPAEHCPAIEHFTGVLRETIRPDVDWYPMRSSGKKAA